MQRSVFISYAHQDKPVADAVCARLEQSGIRCWIAPRDIQPGREWGESIISAIEASAILVLVFSRESNESKQVLREVTAAVNHDVIVIPFRVHDVAPSKSMEYLLNVPHWLDAMTPPLDRHIDALRRTIAGILGVAAGAPRESRAAPSAERARTAPTPAIARRNGGRFAAWSVACGAVLLLGVLYQRSGPGRAQRPPPAVEKAVVAAVDRTPREVEDESALYERAEGIVRSKLLDMQLGGVVGFYRQFADAPTVEAVSRWDRGVRVANADQFERVDLPGRSWTVVYKGTTRPVQGRDILLATGALPVAVAPPAEPDLRSGLITHCPLDGDGRDVVGSNHAVPQGAVLSTDRFGRSGHAYRLQGHGALELQKRLDLPAQGSFTYAFWLYDEADRYDHVWLVDRYGPDGDQSIVGLTADGDASGGFAFNVRYDDGDTPENWFVYTGARKRGAWQHVAMVRDHGRAFRLYLDGEQAGSGLDSGKRVTPKRAKFGHLAEDNEAQPGFVGKLDDIRIYDRALTAGEIRRLTAEGPETR